MFSIFRQKEESKFEKGAPRSHPKYGLGDLGFGNPCSGLIPHPDMNFVISTNQCDQSVIDYLRNKG
jgi:hypothetical protein